MIRDSVTARWDGRRRVASYRSRPSAALDVACTVQLPLLGGRAWFRALAGAGMGPPGAAVMAVCEGLVMHRIAVDPDAEVFGAIDGVVRAFSRAG